MDFSTACNVTKRKRSAAAHLLKGMAEWEGIERNAKCQPVYGRTVFAQQRSEEVASTLHWRIWRGRTSLTRRVEV